MFTKYFDTVLRYPNTYLNDKRGSRPALYFKTKEGLIHEWKIIRPAKKRNTLHIMSGFIGKPREIQLIRVGDKDGVPGGIRSIKLANQLWKEMVDMGYIPDLERLITDIALPLSEYQTFRNDFDERNRAKDISGMRGYQYVQPITNKLRIGIAVKYGRLYAFNNRNNRPVFLSHIESAIINLFSKKQWIMLDCELIIPGLSNFEVYNIFKEVDKRTDYKLYITDYYDFYNVKLPFYDRYAIMEDMVNRLHKAGYEDNVVLCKAEMKIFKKEENLQYPAILLKYYKSYYTPGTKSSYACKWINRDYKVEGN